MQSVCLFQSQAVHSCEHPQGSGFLRARPFVLLLKGSRAPSSGSQEPLKGGKNDGFMGTQLIMSANPKRSVNRRIEEMNVVTSLY